MALCPRAAEQLSNAHVGTCSCLNLTPAAETWETGWWTGCTPLCPLWAPSPVT